MALALLVGCVGASSYLGPIPTDDAAGPIAFDRGPVDATLVGATLVDAGPWRRSLLSWRPNWSQAASDALAHSGGIGAAVGRLARRPESAAPAAVVSSGPPGRAAVSVGARLLGIPTAPANAPPGS